MTRICIISDASSTYVFAADTAAAARDAYAKQAGYSDYEELAEVLGKNVDDAADDLHVQFVTAREVADLIIEHDDIQTLIREFNDAADEGEKNGVNLHRVTDYASLKAAFEDTESTCQALLDMADKAAWGAGQAAGFHGAMDHVIYHFLADEADEGDEEEEVDFHDLAIEAAGTASVGMEGAAYQIELTAEAAEKLGIQRMVSAEQVGRDWFRIQFAMADGSERSIEHTSQIDLSEVEAQRLKDKPALFALEFVGDRLEFDREDAE